MVFYEGFVILHRPKSIPDFTKVNIRFLYGFLVKHPGTVFSKNPPPAN